MISAQYMTEKENMSDIETDQEVLHYQEKFYINCLQLYARLPHEEKFRIDTSVMDIYARWKAVDPKNVRLSFYDILVILLSAMYQEKFGESPVQTAIFSKSYQIDKSQ